MWTLWLLQCILILCSLTPDATELKQRETSNGFGPWDPGTAYIAWCDFNNNSRPFCDWTLPCKVNQGAWIRTKHATPTMGTGPDGDYPDGSGYFIYQEASNLIPFDTNRIESPEIVVSGDICIDFQYHMSGSEDQNELKVIVQNEGLEDLVWSRKGNQSSSWMHGFTTVPFPNERRIKVIFEAVRGLTEYGDTAVDNVGVRNGPCGDGPTTTASPGSVTTSSSSTSLPPPSSESCVVAGDPHYYTFDKQTHHFMGTCAYTLSKLCDANSTLPNFNVEAENEHRGGNTHVSYVRSVNVDVYGLRITLEKGRAVKVNGEGDIIIPFAPSPGVQISSSGLYVVVSTDFGLTVKFDGDHRVEVTLPGSFEGKVCGMCGNYNGNATDDFLNPDGALEPDSTSLGNSWQVSNHTSCPPAPGHDPVCDDSDKQIIASGAFCGLLTDVNGPFRKCHPVLDPNSYFSSCFYDQCELQMDPDSLCKSLQAYADACRAGGAQIDSWRNATFCPILCQPNSHYEACTAACPATCANPRAPASCSLPCVEGCVCDSGYLLYNDGCVPSSQCGCWHNGKHYPVGAEFWTDDTCSSKCRCPSQGSKVTCSSASCPSDHYCGVQNGEPGCYPETYGICRVHNDPHYNTFDRETHHFMGICTYTLAKECVNSSSLPYFNIEAKNEHRGNPTVSYVQKVLVEVYGEHIEILKNHPSQVLVNKVLMTLPVSAVGGSITVSRSGRYVTLETDFRLRVSYDTDHSVEVRVPTTYFNSTCGMCGNFNNRRDDDYMMPDGQQAKNSNELGNSWRVRDDDPSCDDPVPPDICPVEKENLYKTDRYCGLITKRLGPFAACHSVINPESFFESCVYDLCALNGSEGVLCRTLEAYADACQTAGVMLSQWRNATFCPPTCHDSNSHYEPCMTACPATCLDRLAPENCSKPCVEGCACNSGFVLSGGTCVPVGKCGCVFQDRYYSEGESVVTEDCTSRCQCLGNGNMTCSALSCQPHEICKIQNGLRGCYPPSTATCHIYGDPHYTTFDGKLHHFQGACNYTVVETCNNSSGGFKLTTRNEHRGNPSWTAINSVALTLQGVHIALRKNRIVYINGALASPPVTPLPGVTVSLIGHYVHVTTPLGLQLQFNGDHELFVRVTEKHKGSLCGLCGTYTGTQQDDFTRPDGVVVADVNEFGASWSVPDDEWPCNSTVAPPVTCSSSEQQAAEGRCRILTDRDGPFAPCHAAVPPHLYFESCVYDQCAAGGSSEQLCNDLESYATACAEAGVSLGEWTAGTICATISSTVEPSISPSVTNATVPPGHCTMSCSFDDGFCDWTQSISDTLDWKRHRGPTDSPNTGPSYDHTTGDGYFIYLQGSEAGQGDRAHLVSPVCSASGPHCFRFWYHMFGVARAMALRVYVQDDGDLEMVWSQRGNNGDRWNFAEVTVHNRGNMLILLEGERGEDFRSDLAVDDVSLVDGYCPGDEPTTTASTGSVTTSSSSGTTTSLPPPSSGGSPTTGSPTTEKPCQTGRGTCSASGDPHYNTFDGRVHHFMGNCTYTLSKVCNASGGLPPFDVSTTNEHRGSNTKVSYVKSVNVDVYGTQISLLQNRKVNVNGTRRNLPVDIENKIKIQVSGGYVLLETDFGLWVRFDGNHYAEVSVPCDYQGQLCGLCGNYNGDPKDDNRKPNGSIAADSTELGESWLAVENNTVCSPDESGICDPELESEARKNTACGMITDPSGIFKDCHAHVAPDQFLENCVYDWCYTDDKTASLCHGLQAYAESCTNAGVCREWRNSTLCSISCAEGSQYKSCGSRCPSSCMTPSAFSPCSSLPVEGCFCKKGYTLSGDTCVPESECGCVDENNHYHQLNESWFPRDTCKERCSCHGNNSITCTAWECGSLEECRVQDGVLGCFPPFPPEGCRFNCSFDDHFCEWTQSTSDDFDWRRISVAPPYGNISHGGYYISTDSRYARPEEKGQLISPHCTARQAACFRFRYHIAGVADDGALKVYLLQEADGKPLLLWLTTGSKGDSWLEAAVDLHISGGFQVVLEGVTGTDNRTRVSVDDVFLDPGCCLGEPSTTSSPTTVGTSPTGESPTTGSPTSEVPCQTGRGTCSASGDPHYNTFDGRVHHFMGNCTYTLSKVCNASGGLPPFDVSTTNEHRGSNTKVSYVKSVNVEVYGTQISLLKNRKVNVNGTRRNLPVEIENKIKIQISGGYVLLETDFGLWVRFDGNHYAEVSVPCDYQGQLCGLCGNYNGDPKDDNRKPNGSIAADSTELGESWLVVENNTVCSPDEPGICDPQLESEARKNTACGMITDPSGIFKDCHGHVAPQQFLENCVYDMCHTDDPTASLCNGLQAYAESCTNAGICREWRNSTLCPISCPGGSQYKACGSRCPSSCVTPSAFSPCSSLPVEGCFCEEGYTLSGDTCVPESKCGCVDGNNHYHQLGESWFTHDACKERCTCNSNNSIACAAWECGTLEECRVEEGVLGCYSSGRASCQVAGDPHYFTFDKVMHTFLGTCTYTLMKVCNSSSVVPVTISGKNEERGLRGATYLKEVYIDVYGNRITLQKDRAILFNKERIRTPVKNRLRGVSIGNVGIYLVVETDFGLLVKYDGNQHLEISLPKSYFSKVCGMCGNYNDQRGDELLMPNGMQASNVTQFGNSWKVQADSDAGCLPDTREDLGPPCSVEDKPVVEKQCNVLKSDIFKPCHHLVEPDLFIQTCVYDMCKYNGMLSTLCGIAQAYVDTCKQQGVILKWRNSTFCPLPCPSNSYYTDCASPCPATCNDIYAPSLCEKPDECAEGCVCSEGYVLSDDQCVPLSECGCRDKDDSYYSAGESWITAHCTYKCKCQKDNIIKCQPYGCDASEVCVLNNKGKYHCKPTGFGKCLVIGDPHYMTFDGLMHHFQGKKTYVLSQTVSSISDRLPAFSIEGKNKLVTKRPDLSFLQEIHISVYNHTVWLGQKKQLVVDGVNTIPPAQPHEGLRIYQKPMRIYLETDFGLSLSYDGVENLDMVLANTYKNKVEGLCGNFDGKYKNDFTKPDGTRVQDVDVFGESWKVPVTRTVSRRRRDVLSDEQLDALELNTGLTRGCSSSQLSLVNSTSKCGILTDPNGPFAKCHPNVSVSFSQMGCVFDLCAEADNSAVLCRHLEQYAQTCQQNGVTLENWRQQTSCEMQCPLNSKYSSCMSACPDSCSNLAASSECEAPCVEGCECLSGYVLSGYNCVPYKACGCTFLGTYYQAGEKFTTEDCSQTCVCTESSSIACSRATCARSEICAVANFTRGCYAPGPCLADPCDNGGICTEATDQSSNSSANFSCVCPEGYQGLRCEDEVITQVNKPKPPVDPLVYILVGIAAGILVLAVLIALAVWLAKSRNNRKNALEFPRRNLSLNQSRDSLDQDTHRPDYNYMVNAAFAQDENQPRFN